jgi:hypothetical protein
MPAGFNILEYYNRLKNGGGALTQQGDKFAGMTAGPFLNNPALNEPVVNPQTQNSNLAPPGTNNTGNARGSALTRPDDQIGFNEMMIRTGGAMMGGARDGGLAAMNAATDEYGNIQDANRTSALNAYETQMSALDKANAAAAKNSTEDKEVLAHAGAKLSTVKQAIAGLKKHPGKTTGPFASTTQRLQDKLTGHERENLRLLMQSIKVDATLANTARTKGAISDREMALFMSPIPPFTDDEKIWMQYLLDYEAALTNMYKAYGGSDPGLSSGGSSGSSSGSAVFDEADAILGN